MAEMNRSGRGLDPGIEKLLSGGRGHEKPSAGGKASAERDKRAVLSVGQVNAYVKRIIDSDRILANIFVRGEISNFTDHYRTGHLYFTLKDEDGAISAVMFRNAAEKLRFIPEDGMKVILHGRVSAFVKTGQYQIYVDDIEPDGVGSLYFAFEQLKRKLAAEGLFDETRKRPLPRYPSRVGVITSPTGAAIRDIINISGRRYPLAELILYPALVQGDEAAASLISGMRYFNTPDENGGDRVDLIIIGRGGGAIEDLWAFNDEVLARNIAASRIPVISAVGHETDFTICDFAADLRAPTPSAAAELAFPDRNDLRRRFMNVITHMSLAMDSRINSERKRLDALARSRSLTDPRYIIDDRRMLLAALSDGLNLRMNSIVRDDRAKLGALTATMRALDPMAVISRGYSAVFGDDGKIVKSVGDVTAGKHLTLRVTDGEIDADVTGIRVIDKKTCNGEENGNE